MKATDVIMKKVYLILGFILILNLLKAQSYTEQILSSGNLGAFGSSVSVYGNLAVIGAGWENTAQANKAGAVYVYENDGTNWVLKQRITNPNGSYDNIFGNSVATNGTFIVIDEPNARQSHIYAKVGSSWVSDTIFHVTNVSSEQYGISCDIYNNTIVIGSGSIFAMNCSAVGSAYVYEYDGGIWSNTTILNPSNGLPHDCFGQSVSIDQNTIVVGAHRGSCYYGDQGYVTVFGKSGANWIELQKIFAPDGTSGNRFGHTVDIQNSKLLIGMNGSDASGAVYYFEKNSTWDFSQKILTPDPPGLDNFGAAISLYINMALIGAPAYDGEFVNQGAAYIFEFNGSSWNNKVKLSASDAAQNSYYGTRTSLYNNSAFIAGDIPASEPSSVYANQLSECLITVYDTIQVFDTVLVTITDTSYVTVFDTSYVTLTDTTFIIVNDTNYVSVTDTLIINAVLTGISPPNNVNTIKIYPNPASTHILIDYGDFQTMTGYTMTIVNTSGQPVFIQPITQQIVSINISDWTGPGLYLVYVFDNTGNIISTKKILIQ